MRAPGPPAPNGGPLRGGDAGRLPSSRAHRQRAAPSAAGKAGRASPQPRGRQTGSERFVGERHQLALLRLGQGAAQRRPGQDVGGEPASRGDLALVEGLVLGRGPGQGLVGDLGVAQAAASP